MNDNRKEAEESAELPLPSAISQAHGQALARLAAGEDIQLVKHQFTETARGSILASMRRFKTRLVYSDELSLEEARLTFQQIFGATENMFAFIGDTHRNAETSRLLPPKAQRAPQKLSPPTSERKIPERKPSSPQPKVPRAIPNIVPGGAFVMPEFGSPYPKPPLDVPENSGPAFVVYLGTNGSSGFFRYFSNADDVLGAESIAPFSLRGRLIKLFPTVQAARSTYHECLQTGVLAMLARNDTQNTVYIVTKGFEPGVYTSKKNALIYGLNWRGGEVTCTEGTLVEAKAIFELWNKLGHVSHLRWDRKFVVDMIFSAD